MPAAAEFSFAAAGDHGANPSTEASLAALDGSGVSFYLALGDIHYNQTESDAAWCDYVKRRLPTLGPEFPFQLVSGNHEEQGGPDGYIMDHSACLPDRLGSTGVYGAQYYFDYPAQSPLIRVIMIAADLRVENVNYDYVSGSEAYDWLASAIDSAKPAGIPWIAVGMHKNCITTGAKGCEIGTDLMDLLVAKRVDLVLQGHDHNYQRSKQLALNDATCATVPAGIFDRDCVADDGSDNSYVKGAGTVFRFQARSAVVVTRSALVMRRPDTSRASIARRMDLPGSPSGRSGSTLSLCAPPETSAMRSQSSTPTSTTAAA